MDLSELRAAMEGHAAAWSSLLAADPDPDAEVVTRRDDGSETRTTVGIRLAQVLHHGTDHRSQICTALTALGVEPPGIDVWDFGAWTGASSRSRPRPERPGLGHRLRDWADHRALHSAPASLRSVECKECVLPSAPLRGELTVVRPATADDADLLVAWHADPEVARYWDGETYTREQMFLELASPDVDPYVVQEDGEARRLSPGLVRRRLPRRGRAGHVPHPRGSRSRPRPRRRARAGPLAPRDRADPAPHRRSLPVERARHPGVGEGRLPTGRGAGAGSRAPSAWLLMAADGTAFGLPAEPGDTSPRPTNVVRSSSTRSRRGTGSGSGRSAFARSPTRRSRSRRRSRRSRRGRRPTGGSGSRIRAGSPSPRSTGIAGSASPACSSRRTSPRPPTSSPCGSTRPRGAAASAPSSSAGPIEWAQARGMRRLDLWVTETNEPAAPPLRGKRLRPRHPAPAPRLEPRPDRGDHAPPASLSGLPPIPTTRTAPDAEASGAVERT